MYIAIHSNVKLTETFCLRLLVIFCFSFNSFSSIQFLICIGKRTVYQSAISSIARLLYHNEFCLSSVFSNFFKKIRKFSRPEKTYRFNAVLPTNARLSYHYRETLSNDFRRFFQLFSKNFKPPIYSVFIF